MRNGEVDIDLTGAGQARRWRIELELRTAELPFRWEGDHLHTLESAVTVLDSAELLDFDAPDDDPVPERSKELGDDPLPDEEAAQTRRVEQGLGLDDPAPGADRFEVTEVGAFRPHPPTLVDEVVDSVRAEELGLGHERRRLWQLIERHIARDVAVAGRFERVGATLVVAVGTEPVTSHEFRGCADAVVDGHHASCLEPASGTVHPSERLLADR